MRIRVLPEARDDLREAIAYYRAIKPTAVGKQLAARVLASFKDALNGVEAFPHSRAPHPDIPGVRFVLFNDFPYLAFYTVKEREIVIVAVEYATRDYVDRISKRTEGTK